MAELCTGDLIIPTYEYACSKCEIRIEKYQKFADAPLTICPDCNTATLERLISGGICAFDATPKTLGGLADRNSSASSYHKDSMQQDKHERMNRLVDEKEAVGRTWEKLKKLPKDTQKYIEEGIKT